MSKVMSYYEWLEYMGIEEDSDETMDAYIEALRNMARSACGDQSKENRVIQIGADISVPPDTDIKPIITAIEKAVEGLGYEVMGIMESDTSWSQSAYERGE